MPAPKNVEAYMARLPADARAALEKLRDQIQAAAPEATDAISYQMPAFKFRGRSLVSYAAFKDHLSLFPMTKSIFETYGDELAPYFSGKGTIRFTIERPLPVSLVKKIVKTRMAEIKAREKR